MKKILFGAAALFVLSLAVHAQVAMDRSDILNDPEWQKVYDDYTPDESLIAALRTKAPELQIDVYLGTWCSDSKNHVPVLLKILDVADLPGVTVNWFAVERKASPEQKFYAEERMVERVPTFIFLVDGVEQGRIIENPQSSILEDTLAMLR